MTSHLRILALSLATSALLLSSAYAAQNNGGPTSTPTWTIGTKPHGAIEEVTIKEKSSTTKSGTQSNARPIVRYCGEGPDGKPIYTDTAGCPKGTLIDLKSAPAQ